MNGSRQENRIYDPASGKAASVSRLIEKLGIEALAKKYKVSKSTIQRWKKGVHQPARRTLLRSSRQLLLVVFLILMTGCSAWLGEGVDQTQYYLQ